MTVYPVAGVTILGFYALWCLVTLSIGNSIRQIIAILTRFFEGTSITNLFVFDIFLGVLGVPVTVLLFSIVGIRTTLFTIFLLVIAILSVQIIIYRKSIIKALTSISANPLDSILSQSIVQSFKQRIKSIGLVIIFISVLALKSYVLIGLYVPRGNDAIDWTYLCSMVLDSGELPIISGTAERTISQDPHWIMIGFPTLVVFFTALSGLPLPQVVLLISTLANGLPTLSLYYLAKKITESDGLALSCRLFTGLLAQAPVEHLSWSGTADVLAYFLAPILFWLLIDPKQNTSLSKVAIMFLSLARSLLDHPYALVYSVVGAIPITAYKILSRQSPRKWAGSLLVMVSAVTGAFLAYQLGFLDYPSLARYNPEGW